MVESSKRLRVTASNRIELAKDDYDNSITIEGVDYVLRNLRDEISGNRGGNSSVFRLIVADELDQEEEFDQVTEYVIKISNIPNNIPHSSYTHNRRQRFKREIIALKKAAKRNLQNVVKLITDGEISVGGKDFYFYIMEKGSSDLTDYLSDRKTLQQKIFLFLSILQGIKQLHGIEIYHRDIKHDNVFMFGEECKIGDLGLIRFRNEDKLALDDYQRLGAFGWECPEAMNKLFMESNSEPEFVYDCKIDEASDVFQLGKLFWYILQGNLPIGCIQPSDFRVEDEELFSVLHTLLQHSKDGGAGNRRPLSIPAVETLLHPIAKRYGVV